MSSANIDIYQNSCIYRKLICPSSSEIKGLATNPEETESPATASLLIMLYCGINKKFYQRLLTYDEWTECMPNFTLQEVEKIFKTCITGSPGYTLTVKRTQDKKVTLFFECVERIKDYRWEILLMEKVAYDAQQIDNLSAQYRASVDKIFAPMVLRDTEDSCGDDILDQTNKVPDSVTVPRSDLQQMQELVKRSSIELVQKINNYYNDVGVEREMMPYLNIICTDDKFQSEGPEEPEQQELTELENFIIPTIKYFSDMQKKDQMQRYKRETMSSTLKHTTTTNNLKARRHLVRDPSLSGRRHEVPSPIRSRRSLLRDPSPSSRRPTRGISGSPDGRRSYDAQFQTRLASPKLKMNKAASTMKRNNVDDITESTESASVPEEFEKMTSSEESDEAISTTPANPLKNAKLESSSDSDTLENVEPSVRASNDLEHSDEDGDADKYLYNADKVKSDNTGTLNRGKYGKKGRGGKKILSNKMLKSKFKQRGPK